MRFVPYKSVDFDSLKNYLEYAHSSNQFSNGGMAVKELERRAREMLKIHDNKAVIATSSGTSAIHAILQGIQTKIGNKRIGTHDFNFYSNSIGPAEGPILTDINAHCNIELVNDPYIQGAEIIIVTNIFGHMQNVEYINKHTKGKIVIYDNAASPYTFHQGINSCNFGTASYISLHHTKSIGFGEGGLAIVDVEYEDYVRRACNFGISENGWDERSGNHKMSELCAAGILQYWDQFDIDAMKEIYLENYFKLLYELRASGDQGESWINYADDFFPSCLPFIHQKPATIDDNTREVEAKKYYKPLRDFPVASEIYSRILCYATTTGFEKCIQK